MFDWIKSMLMKRKSIENTESRRKPAGKNRKIRLSPVTLSEYAGLRYLHFGTPWVQGAMRISRPNQLVLSYSHKMVAWMLFRQKPEQIAHLGLGSASLTKFCYHHFPESETHVAEINPDVINICHSMFELPPDDERLHVHQMNALDFVKDEQYTAKFDIMHVDLYDADARGPVLDTPEFYADCSRCLKDDGIMAVNLFGDVPSYGKNIKAIKQSFMEVMALSPVPEGNIIVLAFKKRPFIDIDVCDAEADRIKAATNLPTRGWIKDLKKIIKLQKA